MSTGPVEIGGYRIERELGRGGMGVVYLGRDPQLGRQVAIKVLQQLSDPEVQRRFLVEAQAVARLQHPGIVGVHQVGVDRGSPFLVLDYVAGEGLDARLARTGPLPPREAAALVADLADAIEHAHERGILHRDLKPANVLLDGEGRPRVTDFGLARELSEERERLTATGEIVGTPSYMSPEQAGSGEPVGPATDVYALGSVLFELLTGKPPFAGATLINVLYQVLHAPPKTPSALRAEVPEALDRIVLQALEKEPARRYASAAELGEDLRRFGRGEPVHAARRKAHRRRAPFGIALGVGCAVVVAVLWSRSASPSPQTDTPPSSRPAPGSSHTSSPSSSPKPAKPVGSPATALPAWTWTPPPKNVRIGRVAPAGSAKGFRAWDWDWFPELPARIPSRSFPHLRIRLTAGACLRGGFVAGGAFVALAPGRRRRDPRQATLFRTRDWKVVDQWQSPLVFRSIGMAGSYLARLNRNRGGQVELVQAEGGAAKILSVWSYRSGELNEVAAAQSGKRLALGRRGGGVSLYTAGQPKPEEIPTERSRVSALQFDPTGRYLFVGLKRDFRVIRAGCMVWDVTVLTRPPKLLGPPGSASRLAVSPDGRSLVVASFAGEAWRYQRDREGVLRLVGKPSFLFPSGSTPSGGHSVSYLTFTPDGARLIAASRSDFQIASWKWGTHWTKPERAKLSYRPTRIDVSADGRHLLILGVYPGRGPSTTLLEVWSKDAKD